MKVVYSRLARDGSEGSPDYWQYFGTRRADLAEISRGATVLDVGKGPGSVLLPAAERAGDSGLCIAVDIDADWFRHVLPGIRERGLSNTALAHMDAAHWWEHIDPVEERDPGKLRQFQEYVFEGLQQFRGSDGIRSSKTAVLAFGTKPE